MNNTRGPILKVFIFGLLILFASCNDRKETHKADFNRRLDSLSQLLQKERAEIDSLKRHIQGHQKQDTSHPLLFGTEFRHIENPEKYIKNELQKNKEIIPLNGVLGGTMDFREMEVLSDKWIFALYDDGHIQGKSIYEYELHSNDSLSFSVLVSDHP